MYEIILAGFKIGDFPQNRQFAKLKISLKFRARYTIECEKLGIRPGIESKVLHECLFTQASHHLLIPSNIVQPPLFIVTELFL